MWSRSAAPRKEHAFELDLEWAPSPGKVAAKVLSHLGRWDGNFSYPTFFEVGGIEHFPMDPTSFEAGGIDFFWGSHDKFYEFRVHTTAPTVCKGPHWQCLAYESILHDCSAVYAVTTFEGRIWHMPPPQGLQQLSTLVTSIC